LNQYAKISFSSTHGSKLRAHCREAFIANMLNDNFSGAGVVIF